MVFFKHESSTPSLLVHSLCNKQILWSLLLILITAIVLGTSLLALVYSLPLEPMRESAYRSLATLEAEGIYPSVLSEENAILDNYGECRILNLATYDGNPGIAGAMASLEGHMPKHGDETVTMIQHLRFSLENPDEALPSSCARYWNGFLVPVKLALFVGLDYDNMRALNAVIQAGLIIALVVTSITKRKIGLLPPFALLYMLMNAYAFPFSLEFSIDWYICLLSMIAMLLLPKSQDKLKYGIFAFFIIGIATSYSDLLITPMLTLCIPLATYLFCIAKDRSFNWKEQLALFIAFAAAWSLGYFLFWMAKWIIGSLVLGQNIFEEASKIIGFRTSKDAYGSTFSYTQLAQSIASHYSNGLDIALVSIYAVTYAVLIIISIKQNDEGCGKSLASIIPFLIIGAIPFVWCLIASNHTYIHNWFTYRNFAIPFFALFLWGSQLVSIKRGKAQNAVITETA